MKMPARILLILGAVALVAAIGVLFYGGFEVWRQFLALDALRSREFANPVGVMIGGAALALLAGLLGGYALALPRHPKAPGAKGTKPIPAQQAEPTATDPSTNPHPESLR